MAVFGGNTGSTSYLDQARWMVDVYGPLISDYVVQVSEFLNAESMDDRLIDAYGDGLAIHRWITEPASVPEHEYLISSPVSMPLIGLVQLMQLMVLYKSFNVSPGDLARRFSVATGHSQGIISAVLLSTLTDDEDSFISGSKKALGLWMLIGALPQLAYPYFRLIERGSDGLSKNADVQPTPMVSVQGLTRSQLTNIIDDFNAGQPASVAGDSSRVQPAVANTVDRFVVAGQLEHAAKFARYAKSLSAAPGEDQTKLPLALRKPVISVDFLGMTVPYHCNLLKESVEDIHAILKEKGWTFDAADMRIAVRSSYDGHDIRSESDLTRYLIKSVCILPVDWPCAATAPEITHDVYFGTDGLHGFARLTFSNIEGRGVPVICAGVVSSKSPRLPHIGTNANLYRSKLSDVTAAPNWLAEFGPKLVRVASSDTVHIDSKMHRMYGMPTVMVAGMTPTTVNEDFVAAVSQAGYHVELAGGGIYTADSLDTKVRSLASMLKPGQGITLNCIYFDQKQWSFQFPGILRLRSKEGMPIVGLCIGGGVPSVEKALEIIETLRANGFRHMSFKPSNAQAILTVVEIAQKCDGFPVGLQWTGGRAGGHHSFEDFHQPILQTYGAIRAQKNIALIAGSGFGDGEGSFPYLTGDWSVEFGYAPMPFDGILLGSRVMVAKETATELAAKELIVSVSGLSDAEWTESLDSVQGGVTTITSEYGEKNHVIATRGVRFVQFVHETILSKPRGERRSLLMERKDEIIAGLNASHARPWFGKNANGQVVDLEDMTYAEVIARMVELMYSQKLQRWLYDSYSRIVLDFVNRTELRFADFGTGTGSAIGLMLSEVHPQDFVSQILKAYPDAGTQLIASEDVQYFIALCKRRGQKVVPFAPVLDEDFGMFILKDMLWLSEFLDAVHDGDVQRTVIQQGVVSARYSTRVDEPVRDILDGVYHGHVSALLDKLYDGSKSMVPVVESITSDKVDGSFDMANIVSVQDEIKRIFSVPLSLDKLHAGDQWLQAIAGPRLSWLYFLLTSQILVKGTSYTDNFVGRVMRARPGRVYTVLLDNGLPSKVEVTRGDAAGSQTTELVLEFDKATHQISLYVYHPKRDGIASLHLVLEYHPEQPLAPIHLDTEQYVRGVRQFYAETWRDNSDDPVKFEDILSTDEPITTNGFVITESHLRAHCKNIGNRSQRYACASDDGIRYVPDDFALLSSAPDIICVTASSLFGSGQMNVVQLYNRVRTVDGAPRLAVGDFVNSTMVFDEIVNSPYGRTIKVTFTAFCNRKPMALVEVALLSRNNPASNDMTFQKLRDQRYTVLLKTVADVAVLEAKEWFCYTGAVQSLAPMSEIEFQVDSHYRFKSDTVYSSIQTTGHVYLKPTRGKPVLIGEVNFVWGEAAADPVIEYLKRHSVGSNAVLFEDGGYSIVPLAGESQVTSETQKTNDDCARISGDYNPIHTNPYIADIAGLPDTITHGVWTSLALRAVMESCAADDQPGRAHSYQTDFVGMVIPGDTLKTKLRHIGMSDGRMVVHAETFNQHSEVVLKCSTEIKQPATAYVFTGQGLQEVGMGMALYAQSGAAKSIWDRADDHIRTFYGISILDIVRKNPKAVTVYFGGRQGETILSNYMSLTREDSAAKEAVDSVVPLFPEIDADSECFTFVSPTGLLNATQFTQVALVVLSMAAIADMRAKGLIQRDAAFAGHSLGEYCALATLSDIFTLEDVIDVVFYRGLVMQSVVERNDQGISQYGMVAVNPSRLGSWFSEAELAAVVAGIAEQDSNRGLIEVVNFNVKGEQYVVAGSLSQLTALRMVLDRLAADTNKSADNTEQRIQSAVEAVFAMGPISADEQPQRGQATVPLAGIDVPFHSSLLKRGVSSFRGILKQRICSEFIDVKQLSQKYIPNLTATPFEVSKSYFERVYQISGSSVIGDILENWSDNEEIAEDSDKAAELAAALVIELLAYQFASPVQWISTQDQLFNRFGIARLIEIGAAPVLCGMADKTLHSLHSNDGSVSVLHIDRDAEKVYYTERTQKSEENTSPVSDDSPAPAPAPAPVTQPVAEAAIAQTVPDTAKDSGAPDFAAAADIVDVPLQPISVLHAIIAHKTKQSLSAVSLQSTIKGLVGGKSTLQNEIVGDIHKEFEGKVPDNVEEMPLQEVAGAVGASGANGVSLGKYTQSLVSRLFSTKMPGGFTVSSVRGLLESSYGLGPRRQDAALLVALTMEPSDRLANEQVANAWVDTVAKAYAQSAGISFAKRSGAAASGGRSSAKSLISSAALDGLQKKQREHTMQQIEVLARYAGLDLRQSGRLADKHQAQTSNTQVKLDSVYSEFGEELIDGVKSRFDIRRIRRFDSYWNWARQQAFEWVQSTVVSGKLVENAQLLHYLRNSSHPELVKMLAGMAGVFETAANPALEPALQLAKQIHSVCTDALMQPPVYVEFSTPTRPKTSISSNGNVSYSEVPRDAEPDYTAFVERIRRQSQAAAESEDEPLPLLYICERVIDKQSAGKVWKYSNRLSQTYYDSMYSAATTGLSFAGKTALVTGCGRNSIGLEIVRGLLSGGAKVIATYFTHSLAAIRGFEQLYRDHGARGSELILVPFNQGSASDIKELIDYIYRDVNSKGLGWDLDYVFPFAAVTDIGSFATNLSSQSEFAQRVMLTNTLRLLGAIKLAKEQRRYFGRPTLIIVPLSPNHGDFGGDGLYGETKLGLETTFNRWTSESWKGYLSIAGTAIGGTRGTASMLANNLIAEQIEDLGARMFSTCEMAFCILGILHKQICRAAHNAPMLVDLRGDFQKVVDMHSATVKARQTIDAISATKQIIGKELALDLQATSRIAGSIDSYATDADVLANHMLRMPNPVDVSRLKHLPNLQGMLNLDKIVVITGYGEVGSYGHSETRWEMEAFGELSVEGCIELAWIMGLIKHFNGVHPATDKHYVGWVDAKSNDPVSDTQIKPRYETYILEHTGGRLIEPELANGYDPTNSFVLREIQLEHDMEPFETTLDAAQAYKQHNRHKVDIWENKNSKGSWFVRFFKGALVRVPAAINPSRLVAALLPTGWDARRFGISEEIIDQVDPVTLFALVAMVEALVRSGITDPYELYMYMHVSEVGNTTGATSGGVKSSCDVFRKRFMDSGINADAFQESFVSTVQAWINMLLMSGSGPVKPISGACATVAASIDAAVESIQLGKARFMVAGGFEDFSEVSSIEFANVGATSNTLDEIASGRAPSEMCRPCTSTRSGVMEGHGASIVTLMSASAAIEMGVPIYGIVAMSGTATDKQSESMPAPGKGILTSGREAKSDCLPMRELSVAYRQSQLKRRLGELDTWKAEEYMQVDSKDVAMADCSMTNDRVAWQKRVDARYKRQKKSIQDVWGNEFWKQDHFISPLRGSLAVWGLTADDIGLASFHATATVSNDKNESDVLNAKLKHIGCTPGHVLPIVCQKWLTGHPKAPAAGFMLNGIIQSMRTGLIPGNRNADNIDPDFQQYDYALYLSKTIQTPGIKAALLTSFGFGQVGGELLIVHPDYLFAAVIPKEIDSYNKKLDQRKKNSNRYWQDTLVGNHPFVQVKENPPYTANQEKEVYLNPLAHAKYDAKTKQYKF
ncbi:fatty acid synthase alpha subunit Lsd1 [Coemansia sp. RSA 485]|nr:fatty acid synthase alpha subunit Lsd1 [Coemansia sp. RSA 485]